MNNIYRLVFSTSTNTWTAVAENARGRGKGSSRKLVAAALSLAVSLGQAAPLGGTVASGAGSISKAGSATTITQTTPNLTLNWKSFNIGATESVKFVQPSAASVAVNRIHDTNGSQILGRLSANGQVYLINPNGILFGKDAQVNVAGLHASTQTLNNTGTGSATPYGPGSIVNFGTLTALNGGFVTLQADTVTNTGLISAQTVGTQTGTIKLLGNMRNGTVNVGGTLDASAPNGGNGGFIDTSAASVKIGNAAQVITNARLGTTGNWLIDPTDFTISPSGGDITGAQLGLLLKLNSIVIEAIALPISVPSATTLVGAVGTAGNIYVNDNVSWIANTLTLKADNNITINAHMKGSGTAKLALEYGQGSVVPPTITIDTSNYIVNMPIDLPAGPNFSTKLGNNGVVKNFTVIDSLGLTGSITAKDFQGINGDSNGFYALGKNLDAKGMIVDPIGSFSGTFDGLGHTISNVDMNYVGATPQMGLFVVATLSSAIKNVGLLNGKVVAGVNTGGLVGFNSGTIDNSYNTGSVFGAGGVGGLVGRNAAGMISNSYSTGSVEGDVGVGGMVGANSAGLIVNSYATGTVTSTGAGIGGLVGFSTTGDIVNSFASGAVIGATNVGGLLGSTTTGNIKNSYATGKVLGGTSVGGLVGMSTSNMVSTSYATGEVIGTTTVGGLVGSSTGVVTSSFATGNVTGVTTAGGLVGGTTGPIYDTFATGNVSGSTAAGGLVGNTTSTIANSYAAGALVNVVVSAFVGNTTTAKVDNSYWDNSKSAAVDIYGKALTALEMQNQANFIGWNFSTLWVMGSLYGAPIRPIFKGNWLGPKVTPTVAPTAAPTTMPTVAPTSVPTAAPTAAPTPLPTAPPSASPTPAPTAAPTLPPTASPTSAPTAMPVINPTLPPTTAPTVAPTAGPTSAPVAVPTSSPSVAPTVAPTAGPSTAPTTAPTSAPATAPTSAPTSAPTTAPAEPATQLKAGVNADMNCRAASNPSAQGQTAKPLSSDDRGLPDSSACSVENVPIPEPKSVSL